jgi:hypothetical protein
MYTFLIWKDDSIDSKENQSLIFESVDLFVVLCFSYCSQTYECVSYLWCKGKNYFSIHTFKIPVFWMSEDTTVMIFSRQLNAFSYNYENWLIRLLSWESFTRMKQNLFRNCYWTKIKLAVSFNHTYRYINILSINSHNFYKYVHLVYRE